ncbi:NADH-quinone oxidoreductase subunit N [Roseiflexus sp.]|jgi:NADH-quinone oxidoreductase subunit N|nr:NADH-quinone oxidoreductase subunit N [Roseiflexus sp.]
MSFQITDIPRILPELMLLLLGLLVLGSDILTRWGRGAQAQAERAREAGQLTAVGLGLVFIVGLVQSRFLFTVPDPTGGPLDVLLTLGRNLQAGGPGGSPVLGAFATDEFTMVARLTFIGAALLTSLLAMGYRLTANPGEFYSLLIFSTLGMSIMAAATEFILAYLALELSSIALYVLAGYFRESERSPEAGLKYFLFGSLSSAIFLYGISLTYGFVASENQKAGGTPIIATLFSEVGRFATGDAARSPLLILGMLFVIAGLGYKISVVPFHTWAPDVYQGAPPPVTAFLSTASKAAGFLLLYRLLTTAFPGAVGTPRLEEFSGWTSVLAILALVTVLVGNLAALPQTNARRLLAYSSIGHAGFLLLAVLLWSSTSPVDRTFGTSALIYYLIVYTLTNLGSFGVLAVLTRALGSDDLSAMQGLWRRNMPLTLMMTILILSLAGIPPLAGFWAKFFVFMAGYQAGAVPLVTVAVVMTVVSLYYYLRFLKAMWILPAPSTTPFSTPPVANAAIIVSTVLVVLLGLLPNLIWGTISSAASVAAR